MLELLLGITFTTVVVFNWDRIPGNYLAAIFTLYVARLLGIYRSDFVKRLWEVIYSPFHSPISNVSDVNAPHSGRVAGNVKCSNTGLRNDALGKSECISGSNEVVTACKDLSNANNVSTRTVLSVNGSLLSPLSSSSPVPKKEDRHIAPKQEDSQGQSLKKRNISINLFPDNATSSTRKCYSRKSASNVMDVETFLNVNSPGFTNRLLQATGVEKKGSSVFEADLPVRKFNNFSSSISGSTGYVIHPPYPRMDIGSSSFAPASFDSNNKENEVSASPRKRYIQFGSEIDDDAKRTKSSVSNKYKRSYADIRDGGEERVDESSRKKKCEDCDRSLARLLSYTSGMSIVAPHITTLNLEASKRKSSDKSESTLYDDEEQQSNMSYSSNQRSYSHRMSSDTQNVEEPKSSVTETNEGKNVISSRSLMLGPTSALSPPRQRTSFRSVVHISPGPVPNIDSICNPDFEKEQKRETHDELMKQLFSDHLSEDSTPICNLRPDFKKIRANIRSANTYSKLSVSDDPHNDSPILSSILRSNRPPSPERVGQTSSNEGRYNTCESPTFQMGSKSNYDSVQTNNAAVESFWNSNNAQNCAYSNGDITAQYANETHPQSSVPQFSAFNPQQTNANTESFYVANANLPNSEPQVTGFVSPYSNATNGFGSNVQNANENRGVFEFGSNQASPNSTNSACMFGANIGPQLSNTAANTANIFGSVATQQPTGSNGFGFHSAPTSLSVFGANQPAKSAEFSVGSSQAMNFGTNQTPFQGAFNLNPVADGNALPIFSANQQAASQPFNFGSPSSSVFAFGQQPNASNPASPFTFGATAKTAPGAGLFSIGTATTDRPISRGRRYRK